MGYDSFYNYHPLVNFIYFSLVMVFTMFFLHPIYQGISFLASLVYLLMNSEFKEVKNTLVFALLVLVFSTIFNPLFSHEGITILGYMKSGNPITLESIIFGISTGFMFASILMWFASYNRVMTSDKFIYLFGRILPSFSLILSMVLRFVPLYKEKIREISNSQKLIARDMSQGNLIRKIKNGLTILSIMVTWALENAIETSDSMQSRGYGLKGRTSFSIYKFSLRDKLAIAYLACLGLVIILGSIYGLNTMKFYPRIVMAKFNMRTSLVYLAYLGLSILPIIINIQEEVKWKSIESKI